MSKIPYTFIQTQERYFGKNRLKENNRGDTAS